MKKIILTAICWTIWTTAFGQDAQKYYEQGLEKAQAGQLEEAINLFDKSIELKGDEYVAWYNRGIAKSMLYRYEEALSDFEQTLKLYPNYKKGFINRGTARKRLTDYEGALADYSNAIQLDNNYAEAYYNRGLVYEMLDKKDSACLDYNKANDLGMKIALKKVEKCNDTAKNAIVVHPILWLTKTANNDKYGFTSEKPILAGTGPEGGPANQRAYLDLLRDAKGKTIKYKRLSSCCDYKSENGFLGLAKLDQYEITYLNEKGKEKTATVYISFYDYDEPQILFGFKTIGQK
ncbi:tetratricopeptide repeat protein [Hymenobacter lapidiphilus]|uniref:Tetratricopeptide repeat protein n=1 Tax=Hymenobacter lapidiphilus TaxID=2608003 RepID=A0A7Y7PRP0_9BACT|nr:tetratricopeptide repeat protein [Hymenobacter lapidiphilus]NVO32796.1 tetratricopeptide repeat protein [Hymenobacter lapidiphilus]